MRFNSHLCLLASVLAAASSPTAQNVPVRALTKPEIEFPEPFSEIGGVLELHDRRVVVVDSREFRVRVVDLRSGSGQIVGRNGAGPGEYQSPYQVYGFPGDTIVIQDRLGSAMHLYDANLRAAGDYQPLDDGPGLRASHANVRGSDLLGRLYGEAQPVLFSLGGNAPTLADSAALQRWTRGAAKRDTVTYLSIQKDPTRRVMGEGFVISLPSANPPPYPALRQWAVAPDGRIAILSADPYHVEFVNEGGKRSVGPSITYERVRVTNDHKKAWRAERSKPRMMMMVSRGSSTPTFHLIPPPPVKEPAEWPEYLPPYVSGLESPMVYAPDGLLWVRRTAAANAPETFDVIDRSGRVAERVVLPARTKLVGFGNGVIFAVRIDDDDLQYLERFPLRGR